MAFKASSLTQPTSIIRIVIITLSIIIFPLLGVAYPMTGEEYDYHFYADGESCPVDQNAVTVKLTHIMRSQA